jgi:curli biogenesis system outer membrane secretion channel CsgG
MKNVISGAIAFAMIVGSTTAFAADRGSSGRQKQVRGTQDIPVCSRNLGTIAVVEPEKQWWREFNLGSPEAILKVFISRSGCFTMVNRGRSMQSRAMERALADNGELQSGSNVGRAQVRTADYFLEPDIVSANRNSGGGGAGAVLGGIGGMFGARGLGAIAGSISVKKGEANVTLSVVNARTTEETALVEGYARKSDVSFGAGGGGFFGGTFGGAAGGGYQDTAIGQIIVLAYLDAYTKLVGQLGGLPQNASLEAPRAR